MNRAMSCLKVSGLVHHFDGLRAIDDVSFSVGKGEVVGIIGPNGSGKTTLFNLISGFYLPDKGSIELDGSSIAGFPPHQIAKLGLRRTFQNPRLFDDLNPAQHVIVAQSEAAPDVSIAGLVKQLRTPWVGRVAEAEALLHDVFGNNVPSQTVRALPYGFKRLLEVARCLASSPRLVLLDEPTAGLNEVETADLFALLRHAIEYSAPALLIIEQNVDALFRLCPRIIVMNQGRRIADGSDDEILKDEGVIDAFFGYDEDTSVGA